MMHARISRKCRLALHLLAVWFMVPVMAAQADLLVTAGGESLSGDLTRIVDGILVFRTSLQGQMMLPVSEAKSLSTDSAWVITEAGGTVHIGRFVPQGIAGEPDAGGVSPVTPLDLATIATAKPVPGQPAAVDAPDDGADRWSATAFTGIRAFSGTEDGIEPQIGLSSQWGGLKTDTRLELRFDVAGDDDFPSYLTGGLEVTGPNPEGWAPFARAQVERNTSEALRSRTALTLGARYAAVTGDTGRLEAFAGLGGSYGEWSREYLDGASLRWRTGDEDESVLNLHLGLRYSREVWGGAYVSGEVRLLPGLTDAHDFRAGASSSLVYPVSTRLKLRLDMLLNYDYDPVFEELDTVDTSVGASIQLDF